MKGFINQFKLQRQKDAVKGSTMNNYTDKYQKSGLTPERAALIKDQIFTAFEVEKIYRNNKLGLDALANSIDQDRYKISEVLNAYCSMNFYAFLNSYRIRDAKKMLTENPFISVKSVMYEVGFNSKNSFYTAFKKDTGLSPNEYRNIARFQYNSQVA